MTPLFSVELRKLRGTKSVKALAKDCGVHPETIRQIESGTRAPSNEVLIRWLTQAGVKPGSRSDILASVNSKRVALNGRIRDYELLNQLIGGAGDVDRSALEQAVLELIQECTLVDDETIDYPAYKLKKILDDFIG